MKAHFHPGQTRPAGYVFSIPAEARHLRDNKPSRPFLLLTRCTDEDVATMALMSTKRTEAEYGATLFEFTGERDKQALPGQERSYVNLSSLLLAPGDLLCTSERNLARYLPAVRTALSHALGINRGSADGTPVRSIRGHIVRLTLPMAQKFEFEHGVVVTCPEYSAARRFQVIVPIVDVTWFLADGETLADFRREDSDVIPPPGAVWIPQLPSEWGLPVIDTSRLLTFSERWAESARRDTWLEEQIQEVYPVPVDSLTLSQIEAALTTRLGLP
jgi:hypothetical protein